eukprot:symbB.v1.2.011673.t1/scaffold785.1/size162803/10
MNDLERQLLEVLADVQALRQANEKLDLILKSRQGIDPESSYEPQESILSHVHAPLDAVEEEAEPGDSLEATDLGLRGSPIVEDEVKPHFGLDALEEWRPEETEGDAHPEGLNSFPSFEVEASFPEEPHLHASQELAWPSEELQAPEAVEVMQDTEEVIDDPELDAVWDSFFPSTVPVVPEVSVEALPEIAPETTETMETPSPSAKGKKDVITMSRRERIRLLEHEEALLEECDAQLEAAATPAATGEDGAEQDCVKMALDAAHALHDLSGAPPERPAVPSARKERIAQLERGVAGETFVETEVQEDEKSDGAWLDARRQQRKARLQQRPRAGSPNDVTITTVLPDDAVEGLTGDVAQYEAACKSLARHAHRLSPERLVKAVELLLKHFGHGLGGSEAAEALLGSLAGSMATLGLEPLLQSLKLMALTAQQEQTTLDMLLAQLLVLSRRDSGQFTCSVLAEIAGALGSLQDSGVSAKRGASGSNCAANRRCLEMMMQLMTRQMAEFKEEELALMGPGFVLTYMDDPLRRQLIRQAAILQAGLTEGEVQNAFLRLEEAVRTNSFAFIASLPDESKDYLMKLKMIRQAKNASAVLETEAAWEEEL